MNTLKNMGGALEALFADRVETQARLGLGAKTFRSVILNSDR